MAKLASGEIIALLNALSVSEVGRLERELAAAGTALDELGHGDLSGRLADARSQLRRGDVKEFRRAIAQVTARLGHLK